MKCPKCGYLGFETTDRCRNCGYDFSLAPLSSDPELTLRHADSHLEQPADLDLTGVGRQSDSGHGSSLDLDRLFGAEHDVVRPVAGRVTLAAPTTSGRPTPSRDEPVYVIDTPLPAATDDVAVLALEAIAPAPEPARTGTPAAAPGRATAVGRPSAERFAAADPSTLPFEDPPPVPPPPARAPLAVRRATPDVPRGRSRTTTRPVRTSSLLGLGGPATAAPRPAAADLESLMAPSTLGARLGADAIDTFLLASIDAAVVVLTLRISGLSMTWADLRIVPPIPFAGFIVLLAVVYFAVFTVAGGQTIGKMLMNIKVIGDDGRSVDGAGSVLRALGCLLVPLTLGLSYVPVLVTADRRALHDRLAGTRVVHR